VALWVWAARLEPERWPRPGRQSARTYNHPARNQLCAGSLREPRHGLTWKRRRRPRGCRNRRDHSVAPNPMATASCPGARSVVVTRRSRDAHAKEEEPTPEAEPSRDRGRKTLRSHQRARVQYRSGKVPREKGGEVLRRFHPPAPLPLLWKELVARYLGIRRFTLRS
jgi:hypothetical protein